MKSRWHLLDCDKQMDPCPESEFIDGCPAKHQVKTFRFLSLLAKMGSTLTRPYGDLRQEGIH